jgi:hypothetical protein
MGSHKEASECQIASIDGELEGSLILHNLQRLSSKCDCMLCAHRGWQPK